MPESGSWRRLIAIRIGKAGDSLRPNHCAGGKNRNSFENIACRSVCLAGKGAGRLQSERITFCFLSNIASFRCGALTLLDCRARLLLDARFFGIEHVAELLESGSNLKKLCSWVTAFGITLSTFTVALSTLMKPLQPVEEPPSSRFSMVC